jgi:hypothetical protein
MIAEGEKGWEDKLPEPTVEMIKNQNLFKRDYKKAENIGYNIP